MNIKRRQSAMRRGEITAKILKALKQGTHTVDEMIGILPYRTMYKSMERRKVSHEEILEEGHKKEKQRYYNILWRLKKDGLIQNKQRSKKEDTKYILTNKGKKRLAALISRLSKQLPRPVYERDDVVNAPLIIVAFDIPEVERKKRNWLREVLRNLELKKIQNSVWIGKGMLPEDFIKDLKDLRMTEYIEIFSVTKTGTLQRVK